VWELRCSRQSARESPLCLLPCSKTLLYQRSCSKLARRAFPRDPGRVISERGSTCAGYVGTCAGYVGTAGIGPRRARRKVHNKLDPSCSGLRVMKIKKKNLRTGP
jgi:hypothetical protein